MTPLPRHAQAASAGAALCIFAYLYVLRAYGVSSDFWMMHDQIRDWSLVQASFRDLPLVGTQRTGGGHHLGPVYYWWLWLTRHLVGPWTDDLPHAMGISISAWDSFSFAALGSAWMRWSRRRALPAGVLLLAATSPYEAALARAGWNPVLSLSLLNLGFAAVLLAWPRMTVARCGAAAALAWLAVQAHLGALPGFVAIALCAMARAAVLGGRFRATAAAAAIAVVVIVLQVPYLAAWSQMSGPTAVTDTWRRVVGEPSSFASARGVEFVFSALESLLTGSTALPIAAGGALLAACACAAVVAVLRDPARYAGAAGIPLASAMVAVLLFTVVASTPHTYWIVPILGLLATLVLAGLRFVQDGTGAMGGGAIAVGVLALAVTAQPQRWRQAAWDHRYPSYAAVVTAAREIASAGVKVRAVVGPADDRFPTNSTPLVEWLGGSVDPSSSVVARVDPWGRISLENDANNPR